MRGILYGVGVGPGDPELMTLKAVRLIKENDIIAVPGAEVRETVAYKIAVQAVPELADKELLPIYMPMTHDKAELELNHEKGAKALEALRIFDRSIQVTLLAFRARTPVIGPHPDPISRTFCSFVIGSHSRMFWRICEK